MLGVASGAGVFEFGCKCSVFEGLQVPDSTSKYPPRRFIMSQTFQPQPLSCGVWRCPLPEQRRDEVSESAVHCCLCVLFMYMPRVCTCVCVCVCVCACV